MIAEAIDTLITLGWAFAVWIVLTALVVTVALYAVIVLAWWAGRTVWRGVKAARSRHAGVTAPHWASCGSRVAGNPPAPAGARLRPSWANTQPTNEDTA